MQGGCGSVLMSSKTLVPCCYLEGAMIRGFFLPPQPIHLERVKCSVGKQITIREVKNNGHVSIREAVLKTKPGYEHGAIWVPHKNKNIYISKANITYYGTSRLICE